MPDQLVGFLVEKLQRYRMFYYFGFLVSNIPPVLHTYISFTYHRHYTNLASDCIAKQNLFLSMYINQQDAQILVIRLYFSLEALHVSDCISPSSGATF